MAILPEILKNAACNIENVAEPIVPHIKLRNTRFAAASALLFIVVLGILTSYSAPATADMKKPGSRFPNITPDQITWIGSLPNLGMLFGNFLSGFLTQKFGRKAVLMFTSNIYVMSWLMIAYTSTMPLMYAGRFISGLCAGLCVVAVPSYIVEIAPTEIRGQLTSGFQIAYSVGVLFVMSLGIFLRWSWIAISGAIVIACAACLVLLMPESPPWLVRESRKEEAIRGLKFLKEKEDCQRELQDIVDNIALHQEEGISFKEFLKPEIYKPAGIALALMFFQQGCGISPLLSYTVEIFEATGSSIDPTIAATIVALVQVIGTTLSGSLMDRSGRKRLFITSGICMSVALTVLGIYSLVIIESPINQHVWGLIPLISFTVYIFSFSLGSGPIPYVMIPEMTPIKFRSTVLSMAGVWCSFLAFVANKVFDSMRVSLGDYGVYWTYGFFSFLSAVFGYFVLPETKGLTMRQISTSFSSL